MLSFLRLPRAFLANGRGVVGSSRRCVRDKSVSGRRHMAGREASFFNVSCPRAAQEAGEGVGLVHER